MDQHFGKEAFRNYEEAVRREWVITNGNGSYAGSSIIGANTRKHHGLLIASLHAPTDRHVFVNRIRESLVCGDVSVPLSSGMKRGHREESGYLQQTGFTLFDGVPEFTYFWQGCTIKKSIAYEWEKNTVAILYEIENLGTEKHLILEPVYNDRDHNAGSRKSDLKLAVQPLDGTRKHVVLTSKATPGVKITTYISYGILLFNKPMEYDADITLKTETDTGMSDRDTGAIPFTWDVPVMDHEKRTVRVVVTLEDEFNEKAGETIEAAKKRARDLVAQAGVQDDFVKKLVLAADKFICNRASTGGKTILAGLPWFTDWGRDTMISLTGLTLCTGRFEDCRSILKTFVKYEKNGLLPNMFPDRDCEPIYNTADASLWFFYCAYQYEKYTKDPDFVREELYPAMKRILKAYQNGTDFSIGSDKDGLVHAGSDIDQVTWMDVRVNGKCMTPRHGKPVEINALWYNALCITAHFAGAFEDKETEKECKELAAKVKGSFEKRFWNPDKECLYDVVDEVLEDGTVRDNAQVRPNQIYAVSLPFVPVDTDHAKAIVDKVYSELYTDFGLRTLSRDDPNYHGLYKGALPLRDAAYHNGTSWAYLMGGFITAFCKVYPEKEDLARDLLKPLEQHLNDGGIGGIAEVFDGDAPHISGGCYTQAWSVGEVLRCLKEM